MSVSIFDPFCNELATRESGPFWGGWMDLSSGHQQEDSLQIVAQAAELLTSIISSSSSSGPSTDSPTC